MANLVVNLFRGAGKYIRAAPVVANASVQP